MRTTQTDVETGRHGRLPSAPSLQWPVGLYGFLPDHRTVDESAAAGQPATHSVASIQFIRNFMAPSAFKVAGQPATDRIHNQNAVMVRVVIMLRPETRYRPLSVVGSSHLW